MTNIIKVKFLKNGQPSGRDYTYYTPEPVEVGDTVGIDTDRGVAKGIVSFTDVPEAEIAPFKDKAKTIIGKSRAKCELRILYPTRRRNIHLQRQPGQPEGHGGLQGNAGHHVVRRQKL